MSSDPSTSLTRRAALCGLMWLAGCGFTPAYAPGGVGGALQDSVAVTAPETVSGYVMRQRLVDRLGRAAAPRFTLETTLRQTRAASTITSDGDTTRFDLVGVATWSLTDVQTGLVRDGQVQTFTSYSTTGSTVATQTARTDAENRLATALADQIVTALLAAVAAP